MRPLRALCALGLFALTVTPVEPAPLAPPARFVHPLDPQHARLPAVSPVASVVAEPPRTPPPPRVSAPPSGDAWACIRHHESTDNYAAVNPNGHYGAYQFSQRTWDATAARHGRDDLIGVRPDQASAADQDQMARWLQSDSGWGQWSTRGACGL